MICDITENITDLLIHNETNKQLGISTSTKVRNDKQLFYSFMTEIIFMLNFFRREMAPFERGEANVLPHVVQQIEVENTALLLLTGVLVEKHLSALEGYHHR
jgi:hypothetical protein